MAIIHTAYLFDPVGFHRQLEHVAVFNNRLRLDRLLDSARVAYISRLESSRGLFRCLRFNDEWFDTKDQEVSHTSEWYMILLAQNLVSAPSLSNRQSVSYFVLELVLPIMGWSKEEIGRPLIYGNPLHSLVESSGNALFIREFAGVDQYGGWISAQDSKEMLHRIEALQKEFFTPSDKVIDAIADLAIRWSQSPMEMLSKAYNDAVDMLSAPLIQNQALFICVNL